MDSAKEKEMVSMDRSEAVQRIRALADQIELGIVVLGDHAYEIPEEVELELEAESDEFEIELKWKPIFGYLTR